VRVLSLEVAPLPRTRPGSRCPRAISGADDQDRTGDLVLTKDVLCQLSYIGLTFRDRWCRSRCLAFGKDGAQRQQGGGWSGRRGSNPRPTAWKAVTLPLSYSRLHACSPCLRPTAPPEPPSEKPGHSQQNPLPRSARLFPTAPFDVSEAREPRRTSPSTRSAAHGTKPTLWRGAPSSPTSPQPARARFRREPLKRSWWGGEGSNLRSPMGGRFTVCCD